MRSDCAFWDLEAKRSSRPVHELAGLPAPRPLTTAFTISLAAPSVMAEAAAKQAASRPLWKIKLGGGFWKTAATRPAFPAVRAAAAPNTTLIVDANEGWSESNLPGHLAACATAGVVWSSNRRRGRPVITRRRGIKVKKADPGLRRRKRA